MLRTDLFLFVSLAALPLSAQVDPEIAAEIRREGLEHSQAMQILDELTNSIGHRLTGSDNFTRACHWAKARFESFGLTKVELEHWDTWPIVWNRGQWMGRVLSPEPIELQVATEAWTNGTQGREQGPLVRLPEDVQGLEALGERVRGAWLYGLPPRRGGDELHAKARELGALGFVYASSGDERYPDRMRVFGSRPRSAEIPDDLPRIMVRRDQAERIVALLDGGTEVVCEFDIRNRWRQEPIELHNVIAEIPGTELPEEVVVVCGHLDSWHQATGTTDNGTGTTTTLEAARILAAVGAQPKRTLRFCLWGGEEQGLLGSNRHVTMRRTEMPNVSAVFNHDTGTNWAHSLTVTHAQLEPLQKVFEPVMALAPPDADFDGPVFELRASDRIRGGGGSDHASFLRAGVPAFPWGLEGRSDYFGYTWHSQWDTYDVAIPEYVRHTATVIALAALGTANLPEKLPREGVTAARGSDLKPAFEGRFGLSLGGAGDLDVTDVRADGPAYEMGIRKGDRIVAVQGREVERLLDVQRALRRGEGERILTVKRGEELVEVRYRPSGDEDDDAGRGRRRRRGG